MQDNQNNKKSEIEKEMSLYKSYNEQKKDNEKREIRSRTSHEQSATNTSWMQVEDKMITFDVLKDHILTRDIIMANIYKPFLIQIKGCFIRLSFNNGYAICRIMDICFGKEYSYTLGLNNFNTDIYLVVKHGEVTLETQINYISNSPIIETEYLCQRKQEFEGDIVKDYNRVRKLFDRTLSKIEQRKMDDEKRKFLCGYKKRLCFFKNDLIRKRRDAVQERKADLAKELLEVLGLFNNEEKPMNIIELNEIGRKYNLRVPGGEVDQDQVIKTKDL